MCVGSGRVDWFEGENGEQVYYEEFQPRYFYPSLRLFEIHESAPSEVVQSLNRSFELCFSSPASALNHVRASVEALLTSLKIKRSALTNRKKKRRLSLHERIELLPKKFFDAKEMLLAVKWLGNAGSHGGHPVSADDVWDSYEILSEVFDLIYSLPVSKAKQLAKRINKKKGPRKK